MPLLRYINEPSKFELRQYFYAFADPMAGGHIDENLLGRLVSKYGLDREANQKVRTRLWFKLTKEYNALTGSSHPKAKVAKKWQNVAFRQKNKGLADPPDASSVAIPKLAPRQMLAVAKLPTTSIESIWTVMDFALRDLLLYLVDKHNIEVHFPPKILHRKSIMLMEFFKKIILRKMTMI